MDIQERLAVASRRAPSTEPPCPLAVFRQDVLHLTRVALARSLGVSLQAIANAEYGLAPPSRTLMEAIEAVGHDAQGLHADWCDWMSERYARKAEAIRAAQAKAS